LVVHEFPVARNFTHCGGGVIEDGGRASYRQEVAMERDPVCGMQVDPAKAAGKSDFNGKTYYFCSKTCKARFDANPSQYDK
jgi:Cu+-exporting ATPase